MAKLFLAIYSSSHVYLERFVGFVSGQKDPGFQVQGFTDLSLLEAYLQKKRADALLLVLDEESKQAFRDHHGLIGLMNQLESIVIMMGRQNGCAEWEAFFREEGYEDRIRYINRYQSAMEILAYVRECFPEDRTKASPGEDRSLPWLAGMYSPVDKVSHPQAAAAIMKGKQKVLYINLEPFSGILDVPEEWDDWDPWNQRGEEKWEGAIPESRSDQSDQKESVLKNQPACTISDVIYCYKQTPGKLSEVLNKNKGRRFGMDVLTAPEDLADLEELTEDEWPEFLRAVARAGDYHFIFLDMSAFEWKVAGMVLSYGEFYIPALPYDPEKTFRSVLTRKGGSEQQLRLQQAAKMKAFRKYFTDRGLEEELRRIREVRLESD